MHLARLVSIAALAALTGLGMAACSPRGGESTGTTSGSGTTGSPGATTAPPATTTPATPDSTMPPASAASQ